MRLRNKKTGETIEICKVNPEPFEARDFECNSLAELNEEWEDYEEPKEYWYIDCYGTVIRSLDNGSEWDERRKEIGNYFETREEAEKAVEKLEAWTRLRDKGFKFDGYDVVRNSNGDLCGQLFYNAGNYCIGDVEKDLDLLFGGEE